LLPHNITTRLNYITNLRNFQEHGGSRLCTQAQFEWRAVWIAFVQELRRYGHGVFYYSNEYEPGHTQRNSSWQFDLIADMFRPACYLTGKCEFAAMDLDRKCTIRDRVDANAKAGRPSSEWHLPLHVLRDADPVFVDAGAIHPREWLADPGAAR
jgi:thymidylate synthase ThyX